MTSNSNNNWIQWEYIRCWRICWSIKSCQGRVLELYLILIRDVLRAINDNNNYIENKKSDVCSVGVLLWEMSSGRQPFESFDNIHDEVVLTLLLMLNGKVKLQF
ncbi:hypothetical protein RhiirA4_465713 [Rhizophagus irregularis]|uniref:Protein kinase domain-containing protein n=1 Tax=Rhizophagus irregularis TaxID=588596 RepID=A0A2I1GSN0_9GLOM|nr:hypothetical protein RhiirA4_465713 [Rhizophagus irregularis]